MGTAGFYDMPTPDMAVVAGGVNWILIGVIVGCFAFGILAGILLGKRAMKKRDI